MSEHFLKYLQPAQYDSWLRKVDDPDWYEHRYRDQKDSAMASAIRELRDVLAQRKELLEALSYALVIRGIECLHTTPAPDPICAKCIADAAIAKAEGK